MCKREAARLAASFFARLSPSAKTAASRACARAATSAAHACLGIATLGRYPGPMSSLHKFKIGQVVLYRGDLFRIIRRLEIANGHPTYRIRRESDGSERVGRERDLNDPDSKKRRTKE
jgi:hypothetical protein